MKILPIDDKWSVHYDEGQNDRPMFVTRYGEENGVWDYDNVATAMFYALLAKSEVAA